MTIESRYPQGWAPALIHHVLTRTAAEAPTREAVIDREKTWSYGFLARAAEEYANTLRAAGFAKGQRIIVDLAPSAEALALFFACSMLGLVYVPTDPSSPDSRVSSIASLADAVAYIGRRQGFQSARPGSVSGHLDGGGLSLSGSHSSGPGSDQTGPLPTDLAYIIFTSGSTGTPKGIMMTHGAVVSVFHGLADHCRLRPVDRVGSIAPLQFDFSILDLGVALTSGATLVLVPNLLPHQPRAFIEYLAQTRVSHMSGVPSIWRPTLAEGPERLAALRDLQTVFYGGEGFSCAEIAALRKGRPGLRVINAFGQSESILCSMRDVEHDEGSPRAQPPVGFGFPGIEMVLIGDDGREVTRPGETGELYVGGPCLFSGYWQDAEATQQALRPHPTRPLTGGRMFRSGDLLRIGEDGEYYFAGRRDLQVKLLGNRVEVEEIERCLEYRESKAISVGSASLRQRNPGIMRSPSRPSHRARADAERIQSTLVRAPLSIGGKVSCGRTVRRLRRVNRPNRVSVRETAAVAARAGFDGGARCARGRCLRSLRRSASVRRSSST